MYVAVDDYRVTELSRETVNNSTLVPNLRSFPQIARDVGHFNHTSAMQRWLGTSKPCFNQLASEWPKSVCVHDKAPQ